MRLNLLETYGTSDTKNCVFGKIPSRDLYQYSRCNLFRHHSTYKSKVFQRGRYLVISRDFMEKQGTFECRCKALSTKTGLWGSNFSNQLQNKKRSVFRDRMSLAVARGHRSYQVCVYSKLLCHVFAMWALRGGCARMYRRARSQVRSAWCQEL